MDPILQARGDVNRLTFGCLSTPVTAQSRLERGTAAQVRTEQAAPVSTRNSVLLPATLRVTRGSAGVMRMDQVGSGAGKVLRPISRCVGISHLRDSQGTGVGRVCPLGIPQEGAQDIPPSSAPLTDKRHTGSGPGSFLVVCPASLALQGPREVVGESEQPKAAFSLLASYSY